MRASTRTVTLSCTTTGALGVGSSFTVTAVVQPLAAGTLTSTASIVAGATGAVPVDPNPANDSAIATTVVTGTSPPPPTNCHPSYPTVCTPPPPPDLDCGQIPHRNFQVIYTVPNLIPTTSTATGTGSAARPKRCRFSACGRRRFRTPCSPRARRCHGVPPATPMSPSWTGSAVLSQPKAPSARSAGAAGT